MDRRNIFVLVFVCIIIGMLILTISLRASSDSFTPSSGSCSIMMDQLPPFEPLFLNENYTTDYLHAFVLPNINGFLNFEAGVKFYVSCPGEGNFIVLDGVTTNKQLETAECEKGSRFKIIGKSVNLNNISCTINPPPHQVQYATNKTCGADAANGYKLIEIGYKVSEKFIKHLEICFDEKLKHSLYSHQILGFSISGGRYSLSSSKFIFDQGTFYDKINVAELYTKAIQMKTINKILSLAETDSSYISESSNSTAFLSKGHYTAKADFFYGNQQILTYYYVNAAPQWYTFNSGNWKIIEIKCREFASSRRLNLDIYTGSHGVSKLLNNMQTMTELYLWKTSGTDHGIPVPQLYYKVVYDQKSQSGVAFVGVNNPYVHLPKIDIICEDVCDQIEWIGTDWNRTDISLGYLYCCKVDDLIKIVKDIPLNNVTTLLT